MKIIVFDFEVFRYDALLGTYMVNEGRYWQTWDLNEIRRFYEANKDAVWVGHNNSHYDNAVLQAIVFGQDPYSVGKSIIDSKKPPKLAIKLDYYDTMSRHFASLKVLEAYMGKNISESEVDFDISRPLTAEEKAVTEKYNRDDLDQTFLNLKFVKKEFQLRLDLAKEFGLGLEALHMTEAQLAAKALGARRVRDIENMVLGPRMYPNLQVTNPKATSFYLSKTWDWRNGAGRKSTKITLGGAEHTMAAGGIHAGGLCHVPKAYYLDVSGYYNLVMINYDLLSRAIPPEGRKLYKHMYEEQLRLKKTDPVKRNVYKVVLLAVFGAQSNEHCDFYDPYQGDLVRLTGEMFLVDLLEKLEPVAKVVQSNTDGIMVVPLPGKTEADIRAVTDEWQTRTGFTLKFENIYDIVQRDVNNYMYRDADGNIHVKGEAVKHWTCPVSPFELDSYNSKEPLVISKCIVGYWMEGRKPEDVVAECKEDVRLFQYICKRGTYDRLEFEENGSVSEMQKVNRCFVGKGCFGTVYKCKGGKRDKYPSLPSGVFVHNGEIDRKLTERINYNYYIRRAYERIGEFEERPEQLSLF